MLAPGGGRGEDYPFGGLAEEGENGDGEGEGAAWEGFARGVCWGGFADWEGAVFEGGFVVGGGGRGLFGLVGHFV